VAEDNQIMMGDTVRLRSGPYAGRTGTVVRVSALENQGTSGALVMIMLTDGRINPCYMNNLEKTNGLGLDNHYDKTSNR
jgi:KOW motif